MYKVSNKIILLIISLVLISNGCVQKTVPPYSTAIEVGSKKIFVEIVNTPEKMRQGLSGREKFNDNQGMLFDFRNINLETKRGPSTSSGQNAGKPAFWMKDMKFDLDLIWIKDKKIIGITPNVTRPKSVDEKLPLYYPPDDIDYVLEVNAGWSEKYKIKVGDPLTLPSPLRERD